MSVYTTLYNVNAKNQNDDGYDGQLDEGCFFAQTDYAYTGHYYQKGSVDFSDTLKLGFDIAFLGTDIISLIPGAGIIGKVKDALKFIPYVETVKSVVDISNSFNNIENMKRDAASPAVEKKFTHKPNYNGKNLQLTHGGLSKTSMIAIYSNYKVDSEDNNTQAIESNEKRILIPRTFSFDYFIHLQETQPNVENIDTRYASLFTFNFIPITAQNADSTVVGEKCEYNASFCNSLYSAAFDLDDEGNNTYDYKEIPEVNAVNGAANFDSHILPNYYNLIKFTPDISGYYNITGNYKDGNTSNLGISIYEIGSGVTHLNLGNTIRTSTNGVVTSVLLESGKSYYVKSNLKAGNLSDGFYYGDFSLNFNRDAKLVDIGATTIEFDSSGYSYIKLQADGNYYYTFNTSGINVAMTDENMNNITGYVEAVGVKLDNGTLQYFRIERTSNVDSIVLTVEKRRKIVYKFENGQSDESVWVINDNYPTMPTPNAKSGYRNLGWCEPGETGIHYIQSTIWSIDKADITLVADWAKTYMVHYDTRGGSSILDEEFNERWPAILSKNTKLTGHSLMGWHLSPDCKDSRIEYLPPGINTDTTVYAEWLQVDFTITFKDGGNVLRKYVVREGITVSAPIINNIRYHNGRWKSVFGNTIASGSSYACKGYDEIFNIEWILITPYNAGTYTRNGEYTITDNGVFSQRYDNVFTFSNEVTNLYRTARITVQFTAREKDDGYQHVMLYDGASSGSTLLAEQIFEHGGSKKETSPARYEFVFEIDILYLSNKSLCVRYSASGFGADTWYNSAMTCSIILYE